MTKKRVTKIRRLIIETREDGEVALICGECDRPFLTAKDAEMRFSSRHGSEQHENILTAQHARMILALIERQEESQYERW